MSHGSRKSARVRDNRKRKSERDFGEARRPDTFCAVKIAAAAIDDVEGASPKESNA
jgi:hypothetical protein